MCVRDNMRNLIRLWGLKTTQMNTHVLLFKMMFDIWPFSPCRIKWPVKETHSDSVTRAKETHSIPNQGSMKPTSLWAGKLTNPWAQKQTITSPKSSQSLSLFKLMDWNLSSSQSENLSENPACKKPIICLLPVQLAATCFWQRHLLSWIWFSQKKSLQWFFVCVWSRAESLLGNF